MKKSLDIVKVISITGTILGMAGTALSGWAGNKNMEKLIDEKVKEAIENSQKF